MGVLVYPYTIQTENFNTNTLSGKYTSPSEVNAPKKEHSHSLDTSELKIPFRMAMISQDKVIFDNQEIMNLSRLNGIKALKKDWNENGADIFSPSLINKSKEIIMNLPMQPELFPTAANSIQMEYEKKSGEYLEFNVFLDHTEIFRIDGDQNEEEYTIIEEEQKTLKKLVKEFYA